MFEKDGLSLTRHVLCCLTGHELLKAQHKQKLLAYKDERTQNNQKAVTPLVFEFESLKVNSGNVSKHTLSLTGHVFCYLTGAWTAKSAAQAESPCLQRKLGLRRIRSLVFDYESLKVNSVNIEKHNPSLTGHVFCYLIGAWTAQSAAQADSPYPQRKVGPRTIYQVI